MPEKGLPHPEAREPYWIFVRSFSVSQKSFPMPNWLQFTFVEKSFTFDLSDFTCRNTNILSLICVRPRQDSCPHKYHYFKMTNLHNHD